MIQLFVNEREVVLPSDFSFTLIEENPEITNNGEFTLDITLSLRNPQNAIVFGFLNRINLATITKTAPARMIIDGSPRSGTIIISTNTDIDVIFQFVAGNSELNYIAKNEKKIWELEGWGTETAIDFGKAFQSLNYPGYGKYENTPVPPFYFHTSWMQNYVCTPVKLGNVIANDYNLDMNAISGDIVMQPYLLYYINRLPELLGYSLKSNILESDTRAKKMFLVNSVKSLNYADVLPDMTISEFIDAIECFFNVLFYVNAVDKSISIVRLQSNISNKKEVIINKVLDSFTRDFSQTPKNSRFDYTTVAYDFPDNDYFKYHNLNDDILNKCKLIEYHNPFFPSSINENKLMIYRNIDTTYDYFSRNSGGLTPKIPLTSEQSGTTIMCLINKFTPYGDSRDKILTLKLCPSAMFVNYVTIPALSGTTNASYQMPLSSNDYFIPAEVGFIDLVEKGEKDVSRINIIEVSLYTGRIRLCKSYDSIGQVTETNYPLSHNDIIMEPSYANGFFQAPESLRLRGPLGIVTDYKIQNVIDTDKEYTFYMIDGPDIRANNIFIINNLKYMPITFERIKSEKQTTVKGTFYRMIK